MPAQQTKPTDHPQAVIQQIELLAQNIVLARKRRKETQAQWAKKLGVSQPTMARIEKGDPAVAMASYEMCMWLISPNLALADLIAPQTDLLSLEREITQIRARRATALPAPKAKPDISARAARTQSDSSAQATAGLAALLAPTQGKAK